MASLSRLIGTKTAIVSAGGADASNLEQGQIFVFYDGAQYAEFARSNVCWKAPGNGIAEIEIWGAGGSGARMCCCGAAIPGNPGAYSKKTVNVTSSSWVRGLPGKSCGNASALCFRGCSAASCVTICHAAGCSCMCAQGGRGGYAQCSNGSNSTYCCFRAQGFAGTQIEGVGCGIICNCLAQACAYGGDINCRGSVSCVHFRHCSGSDFTECHVLYVKTPAGLYSSCPATVIASGNCDKNFGGRHYDSYISGLNGLSRNPSVGPEYNYCFQSGQYCGCYESQGCFPMTSVGLPGVGGNPCSSVRDHGTRGGHGAIRIKFIAS